MENDTDRFSKRPELVSRKRTARAQRYEINAAMRYRILGTKQWLEGIVKNISVSGVLIRTTNCLTLGTALEMRFSLPVHLRGENAAEVFCRGSVVRTTQCNDPGEDAMVAARIEHWKFLRQREDRAGNLGVSSAASF